MKSVAIVGAHPKTRKKAPFGDKTVDIWTINEAGGKLPRINAIFQVHEPAVYQGTNLTNKDAWEWYQHARDITIWLQETDSLVPSSKKLPLDAIIQSLLGNIKQGVDTLRQLKYFRATVCYAIAYAIYEHYDHIMLYGFEMLHHSEYVYQRECFAFWVGYAGGRGIELEIYGADTIFNHPLYGYQTLKEFIPVEFTFWERLHLLNVLPKEGNIVTMRTLRGLRQELEFRPEEIETHHIKAVEVDPANHPGLTNVTWDSESPIVVEISETARKIITQAFSTLDGSNKITDELLTLYDKFNAGVE